MLPEELLIYACLKILFPEAPFRSYSEEKYGLITAIIQKIFNIELKNKDLYNYIYRSKNNMVKNLGKTDKGRLRWKVFDENVDRLLLKHGDKILALMLQEDSTLDPELKSAMAEATASECKNQQRDEKLNLEELEKFDLSEKFPGWNYAYDYQKCNGYLYYYVSKGHPQIEIIISKEHAWTMYFEGKERDVDFSWCNMPKKIETLSDLQNMLTSIQSLKPCPAIDFDKFESTFSVSDNGVAFRTKRRNRQHS